MHRVLVFTTHDSFGLLFVWFFFSSFFHCIYNFIALRSVVGQSSTFCAPNVPTDGLEGWKWNIRIIIKIYFIGIEHWHTRHSPKFNANKLFSIGRRRWEKKQQQFFDTQQFWTCICVTWLWRKWTSSQHCTKCWNDDSWIRVASQSIDWNWTWALNVMRMKLTANIENICGKLIRFTFDEM